MNSYKIFITKSAIAAGLIAEGLERNPSWLRLSGDVKSVTNGSVTDEDRIPKLFHDKGYYYALIEYDAGQNCPEYSLFIC